MTIQYADSDGKDVLIVDDTPANLRLLSEMLKEEGYNVRPVLSGRGALKAIESRIPDLVLLDINMPEMNGYDVCRELKQKEKTRDIPILFISALSDIDDKVKALEMGGVDYVTKPFQFEEVSARVKAHLSLRAATIALEKKNAYLERLETLRDNLVHMIVHDIKSVLFGIVGGLETVSELMPKNMPDDTKRIIQGALSSGRQLQNLTKDVLDVSRMEEGKMPLSIAECDVAMLIEDAVADVQGMDMQRTIEKVIGESPTIKCDRNVVRRVILNLLCNAIKYTEEDKAVRVSVSMEDGAVCISVEDQGPGVPESIRDTIFEKFGSLTSRWENKYHSSGLGLTFCKMAVEAHGGVIAVENVAEKGARFWFKLPLRSESTVSIEPPPLFEEMYRVEKRENVFNRRDPEALFTDMLRRSPEVLPAMMSIYGRSTIGRLLPGILHEMNSPLSSARFSIEGLRADLSELLPYLHSLIEYREEPERLIAMLKKTDMAEVLDGEVAGEVVPALDDVISCLKRVDNILRILNDTMAPEIACERYNDTKSIIEGVIDLLRNTFKYSARVHTDLAPDVAPIPDGETFSFLFLNLFLNATEATRCGSVDSNEIRVVTRADPDVFVVSIENADSLLDENSEKRLAPAFSPLDQDISGVGLALTRLIVEQSGGTIEVSHKTGTRAAVEIRLPFTRSDTTRLSHQSLEKRDPMRTKKRILVVDDEMSFRQAIVRALRQYHVVSLGSGGEAQALMKTDSNFDLVMSDMMMPGMTGWELHAWMNENVPELAKRFVFFSGGVFSPDAKRYLETHDVPTCDKSGSLTELKAKIAARISAFENARQSK